MRTTLWSQVLVAIFASVIAGFAVATHAQELQPGIEALWPNDVTCRGTPAPDNLDCRPHDAPVAIAREVRDEDRAAWLRRLDGRVFPREAEWANEAALMLGRDVRSRLQDASLRESRRWAGLKARADWEEFREPRLRALRDSLGLPPTHPGQPPRVLVTRSLEGDGYRIENLVFESRPGLVVTANRYVPAGPAASMPGILISHSHHNPKTQGELQDMGMTWARQGCVVLVMDHLGHGERRQHPFGSERDYPRPFRVGRQDYYFRYVNGVQLQLAGESLMGWMVWDLMRGLDLLLTHPGIDKDRIIVLGAVAGGGDPAAVMGALDPRVKAVVPFNFGGTQPDYVTPADPERDFYWFGVAGWESTRCLRLGAREGFAHWLIVGSLAPRRLIFGQEFAWDPALDPAWPRLRQVFAWYDVPDHLAVASGRGTLKGIPPESSHCNNIGPLHRSAIFPTLKHWFAMPIPEEYSARRPPEELLCLTPEAIHEFRPRPLHTLAEEVGAQRAAAMRRGAAGMGPAERRRRLRESWSLLLGDVEPKAEATILEHRNERTEFATIDRIALQVERDVVLALVLLAPPEKPLTPLPVVVGLAQPGKQEFLERRSESIAALLAGGVGVCMLDVRGTGETRPRDDTRRHNGSATSLSASEWLLGQTLVGSRLRDVRSVLRYLRTRADIDPGRMALWGDSFNPPNPKGRVLELPLDADPFPDLAEPLGGLLALLGGLFEEDIRAVLVRGGLTSYASLLQSSFFYVPHDALIPGVLTAGDLADVAAALAPRALRLENLVDGLNRAVPSDALRETIEPVRAAYRSQNAETRLELGDAENEDSDARWLLRRLIGDGLEGKP